MPRSHWLAPYSHSSHWLPLPPPYRTDTLLICAEKLDLNLSLILRRAGAAVGQCCAVLARPGHAPGRTLAVPVAPHPSTCTTAAAARHCNTPRAAQALPHSKPQVGPGAVYNLPHRLNRSMLLPIITLVHHLISIGTIQSPGITAHGNTGQALYSDC